MIAECKATSYCLNPIELAWSVEVVAGKFLKPIICEPGLYISNSPVPDILFNGKFYSIRNTPNGIIKNSIKCIGDICGDIYNENDKIVYSVNSNIPISESPDIPIRGLAIINKYIDKIILDNSIWIKCKKPDIEEIWKDYVLEEYVNNYQVYELIERIIYEIYERLIHFIGPNKWIIHCKNKPFGCGDTYDILIEKYGDYRIDEWMREHGDEYKSK